GGVRAILHLGGNLLARRQAPKPCDQVEPEVERGGDAARGHDLSLVHDAPVRHDLAAEWAQEIERAVVRRRPLAAKVPRLPEQQCARAVRCERTLRAPLLEVVAEVVVYYRRP